ncbi:MAG: glutathione S-transferase, partial [Rhizobiales bacterium]|nr:glutathione S-transferase [Hyphomicrobiales bacterium]
GLDYEQVDVGGKFGGNKEADYLAMNPMGLVPTLVEEDGFTLWESNSITRYLAGKFSAGTLSPADPHARAIAEAWMDWQLSAIAPMMRPVFWGLVRTKPEDRDMDEINAGIKRGIELWAMLETHLEGRKFVAGDALSIGDIPLGPMAHRFVSLVKDRPATPNLDAWYQRLTERPAFQKICMTPLE